VAELSTDLRYAQAADGCRLQYEIVGAGEPVIFLHGTTAGRDAFVRQRGALSPHYRLILRDLRGHNGAETRIPADYAIDTTEVDDVRAVLDAEGIQQAHVVAHSTGGAIAFAFARRYPERVQRMVLLEPTLIQLMGADHRRMMAADVARYTAAEQTGDPDAALEAMCGKEFGADWATRLHPRLVAQMRSAQAMIAPHTRALEAYPATDAAVCALLPPTLYVHGGASFHWFTSLFAHLTDLLPASAILVVADAGHVMFIQQHERVNAAIHAFLGSAPNEHNMPQT
jgi:pimeloyl-ACP methyl ester carboxylesterase